jgi:hypothetical protein
MRLTAIFAMTVAAEMTIQAGENKKEKVMVYVQNDATVPDQVTNRAEDLASSMFATIDVKIVWRNGELSASSPQRAIAIRLARNTAKAEKPGALAYAKPCEGIHVVVFWDRMEVGLIPTELLAHVMVHEITHILEGVSRHSESGIMRAQWSEDDHKMMKKHPLSFAPEDMELIYRGLAARNASSAGSKMATNPGSGQRRQIEM